MNQLDELLERLGSELDDGLDGSTPAAAENARARLMDAIDGSPRGIDKRRRGWRLGSLRPRGLGRLPSVLATCLGVGVVLVVIAVALEIRGHSSSSATAVGKVLPWGSSLNPSGPTGVIASSVQLATVVPDPEGSGPAWGMKIYRVKGDQTCFQVGREQSGRIGAVGAYGSFGDDGRFHPFTFSDVGFGTCVPSDADQHAFDNVAYANAPASASGEPCPTFSRELPRRVAARIRGRLNARLNAADCKSRNQRLVAFGLLGPDATSVTYRTAHGTATIRTHGPDGAYLIVEPVDPAICGTQCDYSGGGEGTEMSLPIGLIATITYRDAPPCHGPPLTDDGKTLLRFDHCRDVGYVAPYQPKVTAAEVSSPITVHALPGDGPFCGNDQGGLWYVCGPNEIPLGGTTGMVILRISFTARVAVSNNNSGYYVYVKNPHNCGASGGPLEQHVAEDARVTVQQTLQTRCKGTFHGIVEYVPNIGPSALDRSIRLIRQPGALTVGRFTYDLRSVPGPTTSIPNGLLSGTLSVCCTAAGRTFKRGTIVVYGANGTRRYAYAGSSGRFSVSLPPGHYRVAGGIPPGWPVGRCHPFTNSLKKPASTVAIKSSTTTTIAVLCQGQ